MTGAGNVAVALVALWHLYFLVLEMFLWEKPRGLRTFGLTPEFAKASKALAANQGLYDHAFDTLGWERAISLIHPENGRSIRVAERLGERFERQTTVRGQPAGLYVVSRATWKGRAAG